MRRSWCVLVVITCASVAACEGSSTPLPDGAVIDGAQDARDAAANLVPDASTDVAPAGPSCPVIVDGSVGVEPAVDGGGGDVAESAGRVLVQVVQGGPWRTGQASPGLAVNRKGQIFVADGDRIHVVEGSTPSLYLTIGDLTPPSAPDAFGRVYFDDFDVAPNDQLYVLSGQVILRSTRAHDATVWQELPPTQRLNSRRMTVIGDDDVLVTDWATGLSRVTECGAQLIHPQPSVWNPGCTLEDLAAQASGTFLFQPGCNVSPLYRGHADGRGRRVLYEAGYMEDKPPLNAANFLCVADSPDGGFYVVIDDAYNDGPRLYHLAEDAAGSRGVTHVPTTPSLRMVQRAQTEAFAFRYCSLAAGPDGSVFLQTRSQLWRISP